MGNLLVGQLMVQMREQYFIGQENSQLRMYVD